VQEPFSPVLNNKLQINNLHLQKSEGDVSWAEKRNRKAKRRILGSIERRAAEIARSWVQEHKGDENIVKTYGKVFDLNFKNARKDLNSIGYPISNQEKQEIKSIIKERKQHKENKKRKRKMKAGVLDNLLESDDTFTYIAGYTENGFPFGMTHEEMENAEDGSYGGQSEDFVREEA